MNEITQQPKETAYNGNVYQGAIIRLIIVAVIVGGAILYSRSQVPENTSEQIDREAPAILPVAQSADAQQKTSALKSETAESMRVQDATITVRALRGQGWTHLARRAIAQYLATSGANQNLSPEQKIYAEDYLQKQFNRGHVQLNTEVTLSIEEIGAAVDTALALSNSQLQNLHQYAIRVSNL